MSTTPRNSPRYYAPAGGLPPQTDLTTDRAVFTEAYAVLPRGTMRDIVTSALPFWEQTWLWVIARPLSGFAETFSQYIVEVSPDGGSDRPELDAGAEGVLFVVDGAVTLTITGEKHEMTPGGYAFLPGRSGVPQVTMARGPPRLHIPRREAATKQDRTEHDRLDVEDASATPSSCHVLSSRRTS